MVTSNNLLVEPDVLVLRNVECVCGVILGVIILYNISTSLSALPSNAAHIQIHWKNYLQYLLLLLNFHLN